MRVQSNSARGFIWMAAAAAAMFVAMFFLVVLAMAWGGWVFPASAVAIPLLIAAVLEFRHRRKAGRPA